MKRFLALLLSVMLLLAGSMFAGTPVTVGYVWVGDGVGACPQTDFGDAWSNYNLDGTGTTTAGPHTFGNVGSFCIKANYNGATSGGIQYLQSQGYATVIVDSDQQATETDIQCPAHVVRGQPFTCTITVKTTP